MDQPSPPARALFGGAVTFGLLYGLLEGSLASAIRLIPPLAAPLNGTAIDIVWIAPVVYGTLFVAIGLLLGIGRRCWPSVRWDVALAATVAGLVVFLLIDLQDHRVSNWASAALGGGAAVQAARSARRRDSRWLLRVSRLMPLAAAAVVGLVIIVGGGSRWSEWIALRRLNAAPPGAPNVLLLVIDTQRADHLSSYGYSRPTTPNLDRLASEAVRFEQAHSPSSWTLPSHASMLTGRRPREHRAGEPMRPFLGRQFPTLPEALDQIGYATGAFVSNNVWLGRQVKLDRGFLHYDDFFEHGREALLKPLLMRKIAWEWAPAMGVRTLSEPRRADSVNAAMLEWIDGLSGRPFFAFLNYMDVHGPYLATPEFEGRFHDTGETPPQHAVTLGPTTDAEAAAFRARVRSNIDGYDSSLAYVDHEIQRLLDALEARHQLANTIVIVTSDHGESFGDHGLVHHGNSLYREQTHVPLLVRLPGGTGKTVTEPVSLTRIPATILSLVGQPDARFPGTALTMPAAPGAHAVTEVARRRFVPKGWPTSQGGLQSVFSEHWHFITSETGKRELYDLAADPAESTNLVDDTGTSRAVADLQHWLTP